MSHPLLSEVHVTEHPSRCRHWPNGDAQCSSDATHWLTHDEGDGVRCISRMCEEHAAHTLATYDEHAEAFGYECLRGWAAVPMVKAVAR